jgi:hypothetical protein
MVPTDEAKNTDYLIKVCIKDNRVINMVTVNTLDPGTDPSSSFRFAIVP